MFKQHSLYYYYFILFIFGYRNFTLHFHFFCLVNITIFLLLSVIYVHMGLSVSRKKLVKHIKFLITNLLQKLSSFYSLFYAAKRRDNNNKN